MALPLVIKATFMLTGMLGLKLYLGSNQTSEVTVPFNLTQGGMAIQPTGVENNLVNLVDEQKTSKIENPRSTRASKTLAMTFPGTDLPYTYDFAKNGKCGPGHCASNQSCVTWLKDNSNKRGISKRESPMMFHECLPSKGSYSKKLDPSGVRLCPNGQTHSIIPESQKCLESDPPCPLVWKFTCVSESDVDVSVHSCKFKKCPSKSACVEQIECDSRDPSNSCLPVAVCVTEA